jgi:hypothetical protein
VTALRDVEVAWDGLWTLYFGLSQFHGHSSWLVCELALRLKVGSNKPAFTPSTLSNAEPRWQMMWHGVKVEVLSLKHRPSHRYLIHMRQECRTFKSVASRPCDWLRFSLSYEGTRSSINKNQW